MNNENEKPLNNVNQILLTQVRECFGNIVYSYKLHQKQIDIYTHNDKCIKIIHIILTMIIAGSVFNSFHTLIGNVSFWRTLVSISALIQTGISLYFLNYSFTVEIQKHENTAVKLWRLREQYLSLLTDIMANSFEYEHLIKERNRLEGETQRVYEYAPRTSKCAYKKTRKALHLEGESSFSTDEINKLLPEDYRDKVIKEKK